MDVAAALPASLQGVDFAKPAAAKQAIQKVRYSHDAMIDMIVANPWISQGELAANFGYTEGWVSQVIASDAFQARLADRKSDLIDPHLRATIEERFKGLVVRSLEILMRKLDRKPQDIPDELAIKALEIASKAAGYGQSKVQANIQNNFVVQVPAKAESTAAWVKQIGAGGSAGTNSPAELARVSVTDAVLVEPLPAAPPASRASGLGAELLDELKRS
jgi:hypothetical protein